MSDMTADCGCQMIQDGIINETPIYGVRFCAIHDPARIRERCAKIAEGVDWGARPIEGVSSEEYYEEVAADYIAKLIRASTDPQQEIRVCPPESTNE